MKKTITTIATAFMMTLTFSSFAAPLLNPLKVKDAKAIMLTYVEATTLGNTDFSKYLFAEDFEYVNTANNDKFNKKQYLKFLNSSKGLKFQCNTSYEVLDQSGQTAVAKAVMKFKNFTRVDFITLSQGKEGWQISKVMTTYP